MPIATPSIAIFSVAIFIAIIKYNALDYSPKHQWERILETMNEGMLIVDNEDRIMYANKAFCEQLEYSTDELKGQVANDLLMTELEGQKKIAQHLKERQEKKSGQYEALLRTKTGQKIWVLISGSPYLDIQGNVIGSIGIFKNINDLKLANQELELFIYKASHDLRGPLASVLGLTGIIKHEIGSKKIKSYAEMIDVSVKKLDTILMTLIKSMQIKETKKIEDEIYLEDLLNDVLRRFTMYEEFARMEVVKNIGVKEPVVSCRVILDSIFQNIIENAIKYQHSHLARPMLKIDISENEQGLQVIF